MTATPIAPCARATCAGAASTPPNPQDFLVQEGAARAVSLRCPPPLGRLTALALRHGSSAEPAAAVPRSRASTLEEGGPDRSTRTTEPVSTGQVGAAQVGAAQVGASGRPMSWDDLNRAASMVYEEVRRHYSHQLKSSNKLRLPNQPNQRSIEDLARWKEALPLLPTLRLDAASKTEACIKRGIGNCGEMAKHAVLVARAAGLTATLWCLQDAQGGAADHLFCLVCGPGEDAVPPDVDLGRRGTGVILDPWAGIIDRAHNYSGRINQKMEKWASVGKKIYSLQHSAWIEATHPDWLKLFNAPRCMKMDF